MVGSGVKWIVNATPPNIHASELLALKYGTIAVTACVENFPEIGMIETNTFVQTGRRSLIALDNRIDW